MLGDPIADLRSPTGSLISVFAARPAPGGFSALMADLLRPIKERSDLLPRPVQKSVQTDVARIRGLASQLEAEGAPGYAIFASCAEDLFIVEPLAHTTDDIATMGPRPYMRPLRAAPRAVRSGVIVADRSVARTFVGFEGLVDEIGPPIEAESSKPNYGGFAGYDEHSARAYESEATNRLWRAATWRMLEQHQESPLDYLALAGPGSTLEGLAGVLHPYLARLPRAELSLNPHGLSMKGLRTEVLGADREIRAQRQSALAGRVCDTAWSGGNGVLGLGSVLDAVNASAVDVLVVAGGFSRDGRICDSCGQLTRSTDPCSACGSATFVVDDIVGAAMDSTVAAGGRVHQISVASALDHEGIGALTRFPVAV